MREYFFNTRIIFGGLGLKLQTSRNEENKIIDRSCKLRSTRKFNISSGGFQPTVYNEAKAFWRYFCNETSKNCDKTKKALTLIARDFNPDRQYELSIILATFLIHDPDKLDFIGTKNGDKMFKAENLLF